MTGNLFFILSILVISLSGFAQSSGNRLIDFGLGAGVVISENIRKDNRASHYRSNPLVLPIPMASLRVWRVNLQGNGVNVNAYREGAFMFAIDVRYMGDLYHGDRMYFRKKSIFAGGMIRFLMFNVSYLQDLESESNGGVFTLSSGFRFPLGGKVMIQPSLGISFFNQSYVGYYFGVREDEVMGDRPAYDPGSGTMVFVRPVLIIPFGSHWSYRLSVGLDSFSSDIYRSPTVTKRTRLTALLGALYLF